MSARRPRPHQRAPRVRDSLALCRRPAHPGRDRAAGDGQRGRHGRARRPRAPCGRRSSTRRRWPTRPTRSTFAPGGRVTVPFKPRASGSLGGRRRGAKGAPGRPPVRQGAPRAAAKAPRLAPAGEPSGSRRAGRRALPRRGTRSIPVDLAAAVDPGGLKREVFGFLPYWELTDSSTRLDWEKLSTIAYFGVGAAGNGDLQKKNSDGSTTVGWSGWTSAKMTERHQCRPRQWRPCRPDRPELRLVVDRCRPARRRCSAARRTGPTSPARSRRPCATAAPTASTSTSNRSSRPMPTSSRRWSARSAPSSTRSRRATS